MHVKITWNGQGGELDSRTIKGKEIPGEEISDALIEMIEGKPLEPGDSFIIEELPSAYKAEAQRQEQMRLRADRKK